MITSDQSLVPAGFYDDAAADAKARNIDLGALHKAEKEAEWASFAAFAEEVEEHAAEAEHDAAEAYAARESAGRLENAMYKGRVDVARFIRGKIAARHTAGESAMPSASVRGSEFCGEKKAEISADDDPPEGMPGAEFVADGESLTLTTISNAAATRISAAEVSALLHRRAAASAAPLPAQIAHRTNAGPAAKRPRRHSASVPPGAAPVDAVDGARADDGVDESVRSAEDEDDEPGGDDDACGWSELLDWRRK